MLLKVDGLAAGWESGVQSEWEKELDDSQDVPFELRRLIKPGTSRNLDISGNGIGNDIANSAASVTTLNTNMTKTSYDNLAFSVSNTHVPFGVHKMPFQLFCQKLIRHFNIAFHKKEVKWHRRLKENSKKVDD